MRMVGALVLALSALVNLVGCVEPTVDLESIELVSRVEGDRFEVLREGSWEPFLVKGVNLGAALPGRFAPEFPDSTIYADWISQMGEMGANAIRVYTRHPPHFYSALRSYNLEHPASPLWLIHGVWADLPPEHFRYDDPEWLEGFYLDIERTVDIVHGQADIPERPGFAGGHYEADVSAWALAYILGREWEGYSAFRYDSIRGNRSGWEGDFVTVRGGGAMDAWLGQAAEEIISYETEVYGTQRPVAYTNWPTTDPLRHPTEPTAALETKIRQFRGEDYERSRFFVGEDEVSLDPNRLRGTEAFKAGFFASYHAYPYYPDFMIFDPEYQRAVSPFGPSNYWGYLSQLKAHHRDMPVLIAEYGIPASLGVSHVNPYGWHHGGNSEDEVAAHNARLTREIVASGMAGGVLFEWIDEWFKKTWITTQFEVPPERDRLWLNRLDSEEHYGVLAMEPEPRLPGASLDERLVAWRRVPPLYEHSAGGSLRALADEAYLWIFVDPGAGPAPERVRVGFDIYDSERGEFLWPGGSARRIPVGIEVLLQATRDTARILYDTYSRGAVITPVPHEGDKLSFEPPIQDPPPGFFRGQFDIVENLQMFTRRNEDGRYAPPLVLIHDRRFGPDTTEYAAIGSDRGLLPAGSPPDGFWEWTDGGVLEVRIPWQLLNIGDPSSLTVLQDSTSQWKGGPLQTVSVEGIRVVAQTSVAGEADGLTFPASHQRDDVARFTWSGWEQPVWRARRRPTFEAMQDVWRNVEELWGVGVADSTMAETEGSTPSAERVEDSIGVAADSAGPAGSP